MTTVLMFIDWYLPGYKAGGPIRSCSNLVGHFKNQIRFCIVTRNTDYQETKPYKNIIPDKWTEIEANVQIFYTSKKRLSINIIKKLIETTAYDTLYINGVYSFYFSILPLIFRKKYKKTIVAPRGMFSPQAFSAKQLKKKSFIFLARAMNIYKNIYFHATNHSEAKNISSLFPKNKVLIAQNLPASLPNNTKTRIKKKGSLKIISIARIAKEKNLFFALDTLSNVKKGMIQYDIFGPIYDDSYWHKCKSLIRDLPKNVSVNYKGALPYNLIGETLSNYHLFFLPTYGENFGHSIVEALANGCVTLISNQTPWKNMCKSRIGWDIPLNNKQDYISAINETLEWTNDEFQTKSSYAIKYASSIINDGNLISQSEKLFEVNA